MAIRDAAPSARRSAGDAQCRVERGEWFLEHRPDPSSEDAPPPHWREADEVLTLEQYGAGDLRGRAQEVQDRAGHAAFAGTGFANDGERPAAPERKADAARGSDLPIVLAIADRQIADFEQRFGG
jgi:hypothetical protein